MTSLPYDIEGKTALVTGGAQRIGRAIAIRLAEAGLNVVIHYNTSEREAEEVAAQAQSCGVSAWKIKADLSVVDDIENIFPTLVESTGSIDFLINNASIFPESSLMSFETHEFFDTITINTIAPLILSRAFVRQAEKGGIIHVLDNRINRIDTRHVSYHLSKKMLHSLTEIMALEYAPGITVNGVAPGLILNPVDKDASYLEKQGSKTLLNRQDCLSNVPEAVLFLVSQSFVTGEVLSVDGGQNIKNLSYGNN